MNTLNAIAVYCGSNFGNTPNYYHAAKLMGETLAKLNISLVYGGGNVGLMGAVADSVLEHGGTAIGVIPTFLKQKEVAHFGLTTLIETSDMATRKYKMIELADGFIAMAGGIGTFEELYEVLSLMQLRQHEKPIGILNTNGFFDNFLASLQQCIDEGFMPQATMDFICVSDHPNDLIQKMRQFQFIDAQKWIRPAWLDA
ncbi:TIGR00730 family Rossman fold protein [Moraxella sp. Tifton1]|uniref:Cytokinin riboside 5'-monophosphate phosphoribohydrolase n=1 Tax=Moraxella oculi TaxID=2940516 RepID=A0ABW8U3I2_9GAMM|nr:TIGR00730 family Rossman fold protein [Moraxella sp. Tifton1]MCL1622818.1 TIGR00730 family Rossman fold protein [Moraxella sp. Tifton1]